MRTQPYAEAWRREAGRTKRELMFSAIAVGLGLLILSWLFPPWTAWNGSALASDQSGAGFRSAFRTPEVWSDNRTFSIDWKMLTFIDLGILVVAASAVWSIKRETE